MRSRPLVTMRYAPPLVRPGDVVRVEVLLDCRERTPVDAIELTLRGSERGVKSAGGLPARDELPLIALRTVERPGALDAGRQRVLAEFALAPGLPPTYHGRSCDVSYSVDVHVDIPWWLDRRVSFEIPVQPALDEREQPRPWLSCTSPDGPVDGRLYLEATVDTPIVEPGGILIGRCSVANGKAARLGAIYVELVAVERAVNDAALVTPPVRRLRWPIAHAPDDGVTVPFALKVPPGLPCTYTGLLSSVEWELQVTAELALRANVSLRIPLEVRERARHDAPSSARVPVGREWRAQVWAQAAEQLGLSQPAGSDELEGQRGPVHVTIFVDPRPRGACFVGELRYPSLGLELHATTRGLARRTVEARDSIQAALFVDPIATSLRKFDDIELDDHGARLVSPGSGQMLAPLIEFASQVLAVADKLATAIQRVQPPASVARLQPAWRAFAERLRGRFVPGDLSIEGGTFDGERVELRTVWSDELVDGTELRVLLDPPLATVPGHERLTPAARSLESELSVGASHATFGPRELSLTLSCATLDPTALAPSLARLVRLADLLRQGGELRGPYR